MADDCKLDQGQLEIHDCCSEESRITC